MEKRSATGPRISKLNNHLQLYRVWIHCSLSRYPPCRACSLLSPTHVVTAGTFAGKVAEVEGWSFRACIENDICRWSNIVDPRCHHSAPPFPKKVRLRHTARLGHCVPSTLVCFTDVAKTKQILASSAASPLTPIGGTGFHHRQLCVMRDGRYVPVLVLGPSRKTTPGA